MDLTGVAAVRTAKKNDSRALYFGATARLQTFLSRVMFVRVPAKANAEESRRTSFSAANEQTNWDAFRQLESRSATSPELR
jgi:hypothetical protein